MVTPVEAQAAALRRTDGQDLQDRSARPAPHRAVRLAAVQFEPSLFRKVENTAVLVRLATEAARTVGRGGLVVVPEMATTGYVFEDRREVAPYVEPIPGPTTGVFGRLAARYGITLVIGLPEIDPRSDAFYNSAALLGPDGEVAGVYRKTHSFHRDTFWAAEGDLGLPVFRGHWPGPLGMLVCMDAGFFETARVLALAGARVLAFPTNWLRQAPSPEWRARAAENGVYLVAADRWGEERGTRFAGGSCVLGPRGEILAERDRGDGVILAEVDLEAATGPPSGAGSLPRRCPDLYHDLLRHPYLWPESYVFGRLPEGSFWLGTLEGNPAEAGAGGGSGDQPAGDRRTAGEPAPKRVGPLPGQPGSRVLVLPPEYYPAEEDLLGQAGRAGCYLAMGLGDGTVVLAGPEGLVGRYRSPHLGGAPRSDSGAMVDPFPVFDLPFARVGLLHPADLLLPEPARILAKKGADAVLASGAWPAALEGLEFLWDERAGTNNIWVAVSAGGNAPAAGVRGQGASPERVGAGLSGVWAETGPGSFSRRKDMLRRLRPSLYTSLVRRLEP